MISARAAQRLAEPAGPVMHVQGVATILTRFSPVSFSTVVVRSGP